MCFYCFTHRLRDRSEDSFVNDGPLSYETCSSQEEGTPSRPRETSVDGADDDVARRRAKRRRGGIEDEKVSHKPAFGEEGRPSLVCTARQTC